MTVDEAILARRTAHAWLPDAVEPEAVERALAAAHRAPCHKLTWPWRFVQVGPEGRARLFDLAVRLKCGDDPPSPKLLEVLTEKVKNPAVLFGVFYVGDADPTRDRENYAATCCAVQNLVLSFAGAGYATKWSTGKLTRHPDALAVLAPEEGWISAGVVWAGVSARLPEITRPALAAVVRRTP